MKRATRSGRTLAGKIATTAALCVAGGTLVAYLPAFAAKGGNGKQTYRTFAVWIAGGGPDQSAFHAPDAKISEETGDRTTQVPVLGIVFDAAHMRNEVPSGENCFAPLENANLILNEEGGLPSIRLPLRGADRSGGGDGMQYMLNFYGEFENPNDWPPAVATTITIAGYDVAPVKKRDAKTGCAGGGNFMEGQEPVIYVDLVQ